MLKNFTSSTSYERSMLGWFLIAITTLIIAGMLLLSVQHDKTAYQNTSAATEGVPQGYIAGAVDGRVAIYMRGDNIPALITDIALSSLPDADQRALEEGIPLATDVALTRLLEDYGS